MKNNTSAPLTVRTNIGVGFNGGSTESKKTNIYAGIISQGGVLS